MRPVLLLLLAEQPTHGYQLLERLEAFDLGGDPGGMYRTLRTLEREGFLSARTSASGGGPDRRVYRLTRAGRAGLDVSAAHLRQTRTEVSRFLSRHATVVTGVPQGPAALPLGPVSKALLNLRAS